MPRFNPNVLKVAEPGSPFRTEVETFIREVFARHYGACVNGFAPHLLAVERDNRILAAAGWRHADAVPLFLERYLDYPIEVVLSRLIERNVARDRIVEVGHLASMTPGGSLVLMQELAQRLHRTGQEWVVFTATQELIGMFARLGLPLLVLSRADPARLGTEAGSWGRYYDTQPIVVAGRIRLGLERMELAREEP